MNTWPPYRDEVCLGKNEYVKIMVENEYMKETLNFISNSLMCAQGTGEDVRYSQLYEIASAMDDLQVKLGPIWRWK